MPTNENAQNDHPSDQQKFEVGAAILKAVPRAVKGLTKSEVQTLIGDQQSLTNAASKAMTEAFRTVLTVSLDFKQFVLWLRKNKLESRLPIEKQIADQEKFYQQFYGKDFLIGRKKIRVKARRLPAIKAGLEARSINYALIKATPAILSEAEKKMTGAQFFFERLIKPLKKGGLKIWAENGTDRWTNLELREFLEQCRPVEPEEINADAFKKDWVAEEIRILDQMAASLVQPGTMEIIFTSNLADIPGDQVIVNKDGEIGNPADRSYISAAAKKVRVLSHEEGIILASQLYARDKTYIAPKTWEWRRDLIDHRDKKISPPVSVAHASSIDRELSLHSLNADISFGLYRLRLAL